MMSENQRHELRRSPYTRTGLLVSLLCWTALAHTAQAQENRFMNSARNKTSPVRITTDPVPLDAKVKDGVSNKGVQMKRSLQGQATTGTTTTTWFRIESTSNPNNCVAVLNGNTDYDTLIHLTNCDDSDKTLWSQTTDNYYVRSKLNPQKCIVTTGRFLMLKNCPDYSSRRTQETQQVRTSVTLPTEAAFEAYDDDTIRQRSNSDKCWQLHEVHHGMIELATCGSSDKQHWSATTVVNNVAEVRQAAKDAELKARGFDDWYTIQSTGSSKCVAVEGGEALKLAPIVLVDCDPLDEAQLWTHASSRATEDADHTKIGMIRSKLDPDMCLVPSGSANAHVPLILWYCDPQEEFGSWTVYEEDSSIRATHDAQVCLDTYEYQENQDEEYQHDVIVGTCPEGSDGQIEIGQQWGFQSAYESIGEARVADNASDESDDEDWMTIKSKASGNCLTVEGGEALKLAPIVLKPCEEENDSQLWEHNLSRPTDTPSHVKIGMIRSKLDTDMCLVPSGSADASVPLILWNCDPHEEFGSWNMYLDDSSIRTSSDATVCLDTHELDNQEEDDEFKHDVIIGTCPENGSSTNSQQWEMVVV